MHLLKTGEVTKGQNKQRLANLATATFALVALTGNKKVTDLAGIITSGITLITAIPHLRGIGKRNDAGVRKL